MATLIELTSQLVTAQATTTPMSTEEMLSALTSVHNRLKDLETGVVVSEVPAAENPAPTLSIKDAFKKNEVFCMVCGKGGFKTLTRHLSTAHGLKPREYRKMHGIPAKQSLSAKSYSDSRRKMALDRGLADNLAKAREVRMKNIEARKPAAKTAAAVAKTAPGPKPSAGKTAKKAPTKHVKAP